MKSPRALPFARTAGLAALVLGLCFASPPAGALVFLSTSGGSACNPAYSGSTQFSYTQFYVVNNGATDQYLVCHFPNFSIHAYSDAQPLGLLSVVFRAGATAGTVACTATMGGGTVPIVSQSTKSLTLAAGSADAIQFVAADLPRAHEYEVLAMTCKMPGGFRLGTIQRWEPEPLPGFGWTPPSP